MLNEDRGSTCAAEAVRCSPETAPTAHHTSVRANGVLTVLAGMAHVPLQRTLVDVYEKREREGAPDGLKPLSRTLRWR